MAKDKLMVNNEKYNFFTKIIKKIKSLFIKTKNLNETLQIKEVENTSVEKVETFVDTLKENTSINIENDIKEYNNNKMEEISNMIDGKVSNMRNLSLDNLKKLSKYYDGKIEKLDSKINKLKAS